MINLNRIITGLMESRTWCSLGQCGQQITHNQDMNSSVIRSHHFYLKILCKMNRGKLIKMELCWGVGISIWVRMIILHRFRGWRKKLGNNTKRIIRWVSIIFQILKWKKEIANSLQVSQISLFSEKCRPVTSFFDDFLVYDFPKIIMFFLIPPFWKFMW